jgi:hypothetical protein
MIPTWFRELPSLPLNTNDKVDRKCLESLAQNTGTSAAANSEVSPMRDIASITPANVKTKTTLTLKDQSSDLLTTFLPGARLSATLQKTIRKATLAFNQVLAGHRP